MPQDLVVRAQRGDHDAFASLAAASITRLDATARLILRDPELAQDAVQEALVRAWRDLPGLRDPERFDAWLRRLLVHACLDEARARRRHRFEVELRPVDDRSQPDGVGALAVRDELERGFRRLEPEQRAVIVLHFYLGLAVPEVAQTIGVPVGTAKSRISRALQALRAALDAESRRRETLPRYGEEPSVEIAGGQR